MDLQKRVRASKGHEDEESPEPSETPDNASSLSGSSADDSQVAQDTEDESESASSEIDPRDTLASISFGALASAQASLSRQNGHSTTPAPAQSRHRSASPFHEAAEREAGQKASKKASATAHARSSKQAPTEQSSKRAVTRRRDVVSTSRPAPRDPRFSSLSGALDERRVARNYTFLTDYRAAEAAELRTRIRSVKDERERERLGQELRVLEDRERARKREEGRREVLSRHKREERERVRQGKQPFFLKRRDVRELEREGRLESIGKRRAAKVRERRDKKVAGREKKRLPVRRSAAEFDRATD